MRLSRFVVILANACAVLLLGLVGAAVAGPTLEFSGLDLYGPVTLSSLTTFLVLSSSWLVTMSLSAVSGGLSIYVVPDVANLFSLLSQNTATLTGNGITQLGLLPASNPLFTNIPEPIGLSLLVTGVAAMSFVRRRRRNRRT